MNENGPANQANALFWNSREGDQLRAIAAALIIMPRSGDIVNQLHHLSDVFDECAHLAAEYPRVQAANMSLEAKVAQFTELEKEEQSMLRAIFKAMEDRGSGLQPSGAFRQQMRDLLCHLTVRREDGTYSYDETNKLVAPVRGLDKATVLGNIRDANPRAEKYKEEDDDPFGKVERPATVQRMKDAGFIGFDLKKAVDGGTVRAMYGKWTQVPVDILNECLYFEVFGELYETTAPANDHTEGLHES